MDLRIEPSSTASWQSLVHDALNNCQYRINEDLEAYLIFLLSRFISNTNLAGSVLAIEYLESQPLCGAHKKESLRDVGDKCLLFAGFYPEQAHKKLVSLTYFVNLGRGAYDQIACSPTKTHDIFDGLNKLFKELSEKFVILLNILQQIKLLDKTKTWTPDQITKFETKILGLNHIILNNKIH